MPQEGGLDSKFFSPNNKLRGLKGLISYNNTNHNSNNNNNANGNVAGAGGVADEIINDHELAQRKAEEAGN